MNPAKITETILSQRYIGSVIKTVQADDEDLEEDMADDDHIYAISTVINLAKKTGLNLLQDFNLMPPTTSLPFLAEIRIAPELIERGEHLMFSKYYKPHTASPNAKDIFDRVLNIPTHADLKLLSDDRITSDLERILEHAAKSNSTPSS